MGASPVLAASSAWRRLARNNAEAMSQWFASGTGASARNLKFLPSRLVTPLLCILRFNTVRSEHGEILKRRAKEEQRKTEGNIAWWLFVWKVHRRCTVVRFGNRGWRPAA